MLTKLKSKPLTIFLMNVGAHFSILIIIKVMINVLKEWSLLTGPPLPFPMKQI
jgi:hypothetical protein